MMHVVCQDGFGGCLFALSFIDLCRKLIYKYDAEINLHIISNSQVKLALEPFIGKNTTLIHYNDDISDIGLCKSLKKDNDGAVYCLTPDYFNANEFKVDSHQTGINWRMIKQNRFLQTIPCHKNNNVCLAFTTAQDGNDYLYLNELVNRLCEENPEFNFYFPIIKKWSDRNIDYPLDFSKIENKYKNFCPYEPKRIDKDLNHVARHMRYFIGVDNGVMNLAYFLNRDRILLDSRFDNAAFRIRWRQQGDELIPITTKPNQVSNLFKLTTNMPELNGFDKQYLLSDNLDIEKIKKAFMYKQ